MMDCPHTLQWESFLADQLPDDAESSLEDHLNQCPDCKACLESMTHPSTLDRVAEFLQTLPRRSQVSGRMVDVLLNALNDESNEPSSDVPLPEIPGYQLIELIGQGGSSLVYRAGDSRLQRTVAIKILREKCTPIQRQRFHKEARSLASLHHLNVARIIEVGETAQHTFLVLEYIAGGSLASYLAGMPQSPTQAARLVQQLASAVQKAHDTGFIHRDLKPGNILLDPHFGASETTGLDRFVPKIIDFGIVKDLQPTDDFTQTRDFVGTPSYMAPEQISQSRQPIDVRTDVYALGIILYELLTGRPPFRAASPIDTMLQIKHEEPVPPTRFEPKLNRDLENICLKCIEKDPALRYASAQLLHEDLQRFLLLQPVLARPISWPARCWRWSRRNPGWAIAGFLILLLLSTLAIAGPIVAHRERLLREEAAEHASQAANEKTRAQEHLDLSGQALEEMLDRLLTNMRLQDSAYDDVQKSLVTVALPYLERFVQQVDSAQTLRLRQARSLLQLAMVQVRNKEIDKAQATYERALQQLNELNNDSSISRNALHRAQFSAHMEYGRFLDMHEKDSERAEYHYRQCLQLYNKFDEADKAGKSLDSLAILHSLLGSLLQGTPDRKNESRSHNVKAIELRHQLMKLHPDRDDMRHYAAMAHLNLAIDHRKQREKPQEIEHLRRALTLEKQVNSSKSNGIDSAYHIVTIEGDLALVLVEVNQHEEAIRHFRTASSMANALTLLYPNVEKYAFQARQWKRALEKFDK